MVAFIEYPFDPRFITAYNKMYFGTEKHHLYIEDSSDAWFWEKFIIKSASDKYRIIPWSKRGKSNLAPYYSEAKLEALIAVDSDFDYLCPNIGYGNEFCSNPYLLHTFAYSRESVLIEKSNIQQFISDIKFTITHNIKIDLFIKKFSALVFVGLVKFIHLKNTNGENLNHDEFHQCFHITDKKIVTVSTQNKPIIDMTVLDNILTNFQTYFQTYSISLAEEANARTHLLNLGVNQDNAYRFINGHNLEELIINIVNQLTATLSHLELDIIKKEFQGDQINERRSQVRSILEEESQIKTYLRRYLICDEDEIHQKIFAKIEALKS